MEIKIGNEKFIDFLAQFKFAVTGESRGGSRLHVHLCNEAADQLEGAWLLHRMHEDTDLAGSDDARGFFNKLDDLAPGAFVLIDTGDYVIPSCGGWHRAEQVECETYDPDYRLYLMPRSSWEGQREKVMALDKAWREPRLTCKLPVNA